VKGSWLAWNDDLDFSLTEEDLNVQLMTRQQQDASSGIFGRIKLDRFMLDLEQRGLLERLRKRGYKRFRPQLEQGDNFTQRLRLWAEHPDREEPLQLMDVRSHRGQLETPWGGVYQVLGWDWIEMQDPLARASRYRPLLPGQEHPGLGLFRGLTTLMLEYVHGLDVEALVAVPEYFHNAVLYQPHFRFILPEPQGHFQAMCRDLLHEGLSAASWWIARGEVEITHSADGRRETFEWRPEKIMRPRLAELRARFETDEYRDACQAAMEAVSFEHKAGSASGGGNSAP
jgi:hypothetical protein